MIIDSIIKDDVFGSDHCPIVLLVRLNKLKLDPKIRIQTSKTYTDVATVIHQWKEPLTYRRDNYAHFISEDCEPNNNIAKLLIATNRLDIENLWACRPKKGKVLVTPHGQYKTYSLVVKRRHNDEIDWEYAL